MLSNITNNIGTKQKIDALTTRLSSAKIQGTINNVVAIVDINDIKEIIKSLNDYKLGLPNYRGGDTFDSIRDYFQEGGKVPHFGITTPNYGPTNPNFDLQAT